MCGLCAAGLCSSLLRSGAKTEKRLYAIKKLPGARHDKDNITCISHYLLVILSMRKLLLPGSINR